MDALNETESEIIAAHCIYVETLSAWDLALSLAKLIAIFIF